MLLKGCENNAMEYVPVISLINYKCL